MFACRLCGKEFDDWHALGGHMRTHKEKKKTAVLSHEQEYRKDRLSQALGTLSELTPQEAWQIVVSWIMDIHRQMQIKDELIQSYRLTLHESESRVKTIQSDLKSLQQDVGKGHTASASD